MTSFNIKNNYNYDINLEGHTGWVTSISQLDNGVQNVISLPNNRII